LRIRAKVGTGFVVLRLVLGTTPVAAAMPVGEGPGVHTVTLITGDRVTVLDGTISSVRPAKGREKVTFSRFVAGGHAYVLPNDARRLVATDRLDRRLFDVTTLVEFGYDDAHRDSVPLIVTHPEGRQAPRAAAVSRALPSINGVAMAADKDDAAAVWEALTDGGTTRPAAAGVSKVWLDGKRKSTLDQSVPRIGAPAVWEAGYTGAGVTVAVLDGGVDQTHPDLADREVAERNFSDAPDNVDFDGHGTHVASIVGGTGAKSGGRYRGVAPGVSIVDVKVLNDLGYGQDSWIIAGMEWAAEQGADIANLSLGTDDTTAVDPVEEAVESLSAEYGILFVCAAGNSGPRSYSVGSPASSPAALSVGAVDRDDALADFSSRGPTEVSGAIKPDVTAPGSCSRTTRTAPRPSACRRAGTWPTTWSAPGRAHTTTRSCSRVSWSTAT
jgi:subtilisin family serine protease